MNEQTPAQQPEAPKARRFTGRHRTLVIAGAAGVLLLGGGTAAAFAADFDDADDRREDNGASQTGLDLDDQYDDNGDGSDDDFQLPAGAIGEDAAAEAALTAVDGTVRDADLEGTAEAPVWIIDITDADGVEWDVAVDALDGTVLDSAQDDDSDDGSDDDDDRDDSDGDDNDDSDDGRDDTDDRGDD
ncbi:PepSY domain-containing protein [Glycomyces albidus]|uniref:DNA primase n=1 Tax=Glycomyces albidus TaxID=2656774 RepID=A0A6L5G6Y7_9ACTN|nr:PepSY domain-containing protein [Glycomyces albidus]MQM25395.1 DNA primase [Glycomyces albidus]